MTGFKHLIEAFLNPLFVYVCLVIITLIAEKYNVLKKSIAFSLIILFLLLISTSFLPKFLVDNLENKYPTVNQIDPDIKWIVVLSGGQGNLQGKPDTMQLYSASVKRLIEGVRLYQQLPNAQLLLSGGAYKTEQTEASRLATLATMFALPNKQIILETKSINTAEQAQLIKKMINDQPFYLVTSAMHMRRSMQLFHHQKMYPIAAPTDFTLYWHDERWEKVFFPNPQNIVYLSMILHEWLGIAWYRVCKYF